MHVITKPIFVAFLTRHPDAESPLNVWYHLINPIAPRPVEPVRAIIVFHQQIHLDFLTTLSLQTVDNLPYSEILTHEVLRLNPTILGSFPRLNEFPSLFGILIDV